MPKVPTAPVFTSTMSSLSQLNQLADAVRFAMNPPLADLVQMVAQSIPTGVWTAVTFDAFDIDTDVDGIGGHSTAVNSTRFTARYPGWYQLVGGVGHNPSAVGVRGSYWAVNGVAVTGSQSLLSAASAFETASPARYRDVYLSEGYYAELFTYQSTAGALLTSVTGANHPTASIRWLRF